jgi:hypothetical protein
MNRRKQFEPQRRSPQKTIDHVNGILFMRHDDLFLDRRVLHLVPPNRQAHLQPELCQVFRDVRSLVVGFAAFAAEFEQRSIGQPHSLRQM